MYRTLDLSSKIKMIVSDFDGIFTDNSVFVLSPTEKLKKISYKDIMGVSLAVKNGINVAIVSGECSKEIDYIAEKFNLEDIHQGIRIKYPVFLQIKEKYGLSDDEIIYIGDDINDIDCLSNTKYAVSVPEANYKVKQINHVQITTSCAGDGAFREVVDNIIELRTNEK